MPNNFRLYHEMKRQLCQWLSGERITRINNMVLHLAKTRYAGLVRQDVLYHPDFQAGIATTQFIPQHFADRQPAIVELPIEVHRAPPMLGRCVLSRFPAAKKSQKDKPCRSSRR